MDIEAQKLKVNNLALDVLGTCRNNLLVNLRFLDLALNHLEAEPIDMPLLDGCISSNGKSVYYYAPMLLLKYRNSSETVMRDYLHTVFHCVFQHQFVGELVDAECWNLACDIAVENVINDLELQSLSHIRRQAQVKVIEELYDNARIMTAEGIYRYYLDKGLTPEELRELRRPFVGDDHALWYATTGDEEDPSNDSQKPSGGSDGFDNQEQKVTSAETKDEWTQIAKRMQIDLVSFSKQHGDVAGALTQNLRAVTKKKYDYSAFLKRFCVLGEALKTNDEEFDYPFYTYGMQLYGNMPLIEPLEYKEVKRIREFVIAIDTSGSVSDELVQRFIEKTYNILKQRDSFFAKVNIHIIQCDTKIQEDARITNDTELEEYISHMTIHGRGGTDFRPVFRYVDDLRKRREINNLKGLIYFTDGYGTFPKEKPEYDTAFVFIEGDIEIPKIPAWAIKLVLAAEEI